MPQPTQHSLIRVLLLWTTVLSIIQAVFIILFFTVGHLGLSQNSSTVAPECPMQSKADNRPTPSPPLPKDRLLLGKGKTLTYEATLDNGQIQWRTKNNENGVISDEGKELKITMDGYYFLSLQVTLKTCKCSCNGTVRGSEHMVSVTHNTGILMQGWINTCSTGLLSKAQMLTVPDTLKFNFTLQPKEIDANVRRTHLDIIFFQI
ncbi:tumor necrosis factor ligand superfamily member 18 [Pagrus major]|uniref:tumor necrosis factor ligand superfamily member 18 n=1 Tax=Pagrus major TaxID=143350 RepID=UPI003CC8D51C